MQFTHEHEEIQRTLKRFIDEEINPHVDEWEAAEAFPAHEVFKRLGDLGLLGLTKPAEYGGMGLDYSLLDRDGRNAGPCGVRRDPDGRRRADRHGHASPGPLRL
jgi:alkylation response protein AidB-like acyl-CoA dehydrogenase